MTKNRGNNGVIRVRYTADTQWARDTGRYQKEAILISTGCNRQDLIDDDDLTVPYVTVRFDGESNNANVTAYFLELI